MSHIREVDVIMYVLRSFESENIVHVYDRVNPVEDFEIVQSELIFKDIETVEKRIGGVTKTARVGNEQSQMELKILERILKDLNEGIAVVDMEFKDDEQEFVYDLWLLTAKKRMFLLNTKEGLNEDKLEGWSKELNELTGDPVLTTDVKLVGEMSGMNEEEIGEYVELLGYKPTQMKDVIKCAYDRLNLLTFYTGSEKECNAWTIEKGATVKEAAGVIHTDLEENFITADVVKLEDLLECGGWNEAKEQGKIRNHGKEYLIEDGDYVVILANA